mmetsp:Transcript_14681/g.35801  ORF Transcript_14681/g.35801 Transcript_14681/m.35801 type:complete len:1054 (+) Transcript_14681:200-3361(+)
MTPSPRPTGGGWGAEDDVEMIYDYNGNMISQAGSNGGSSNNSRSRSGGASRSRSQQQQQQQQQRQQQTDISGNSMSTTAANNRTNSRNVSADTNNSRMNKSSGGKGGGVRFSQVDLDNVFDPFAAQQDDVAEFFDEDDQQYDADQKKSGGKFSYGEDEDAENPNRVYSDPTRTGVLNDAVHQIAGSPWAKPAYNPSNRPTDPLPIAKYTSGIALTLTLGLVIFLLGASIYNYTSIGRIIVEVILAILSFFGLFWNSYFTVSSIFKCFIPAKAYQSNTKYCSLIPEKKPEKEPWLNVTIQIPVYKESLQEVMMPTLKSCTAAQRHYEETTGAKCNIVLCDDGMMAYMKNNFAACEMLWETIEQTKGRVFKLSHLLNQVPRPSRRHLKGLSSKNVYEVFHRMLFYYHYNIGFVARSTWDRRGKFKKASNINTHLRLVWGAEQLAGAEGITYEEALMDNCHTPEGGRFTMFGGDVSIGNLILINDADARMSKEVITKTVPEFLNDKSLGFTQHATKTMDDQRGESYYINMLSAYTDALYQGHFLLSSILGCHPPLVGHSIILRSDAVRQTGRIRTLRKAKRWLKNIGLPFVSVDQIGSYNLQDDGTTEYWSENHVSEDFELMIHLYNLGFNGRYVDYPNCEFQEGITRTFDEEAGRHRKFALGAHELMFNPFGEWIGKGIFTELFGTFLRSDIPGYYKIFLTAYLFSYTSGGTYIMVFSIAAIARLLDSEQESGYLSAFNSAGVLALSVIVYYIVGYTTFLYTMVRMKWCNNNILFPEYRHNNSLYLVWRLIRYCMYFQMTFYSVMGNYFFLGSMDHMLARSGIVSATNKDSIEISRCTALWDLIKFNLGSWGIAIYMLALCYLVILQDADWNFTEWPKNRLDVFLFTLPAAFISICAFIVPIILNPFVLGWPFNPPLCRRFVPNDDEDDEEIYPTKRRNASGRTVDLNTFMNADKRLDKEIGRTHDRPDVEIGSIATKDLRKDSAYGGATFAMHSQRNIRDRRSPQSQQSTSPTIQEGREFSGRQDFSSGGRQYSGRVKPPGDRSGGNAFSLAMF